MYSIHIPGDTILADTLAQVFYIFFHDARLSAYETREIALKKGGEPLPILRYNGILAVRQPGSAESIFTAMFEEIRNRWFLDNGTQRHVWQIPRHQWEIFQFVFDLGNKPALMLSSAQLEAEVEAARGDGRSFSLRVACSHASDRVFGFGSEGPRALSGTVNGRHEVHVVQALLLGKPIPDSVLDEYRANPALFGSDLKWAQAPLKVPVLRNALPYDVLRAAVSILGHEKRDIDAELGAQMVGALRGLPATATYVEVDDLLYAAGIVGPEALPEAYQRQVDVGLPVSPVAERLRRLIADLVRGRELAALEKSLATGQISKRRYAMQVAIAHLAHGRHTFEWPNRFATALATHDLPLLLEALDRPDGDNESSKQVVAEHFGLKLRGLNSKRRRRGIFALCGYDEAAQAEWEAQRETERAHAKAREAANDAKERASKARYRCADRTVISGVEHVDRALAAGFTVIRDYRHGASRRYAMVNPASREARNLRANDGTLQYARSLLEPLAA